MLVARSRAKSCEADWDVPLFPDQDMGCKNNITVASGTSGTSVTPLINGKKAFISYELGNGEGA
jgi:hypothetical protein